MKTSAKQYAQTLYELCNDKKESEIKKIVAAFFEVLLRNNAVARSSEIIAEFEKIWNREKGIMPVEIVSARELSKDEKAGIGSYIKAKTSANEVLMKESIDADTIGGVVVKYSDKVLDGSLRTRISELRDIMRK